DRLGGYLDPVDPNLAEAGRRGEHRLRSAASVAFAGAGHDRRPACRGIAEVDDIELAGHAPSCPLSAVCRSPVVPLSLGAVPAGPCVGERTRSFFEERERTI